MKRLLYTCYCIGLLFSAVWADPAWASNQGVVISPEPNGRFDYRDDFSTARFLDEAFLDNLKVDCWQPGAITNAGPHSNRVLTYRFYGDRVVTDMVVRVEQSANGGNLGGSNHLYLSTNGLDWVRVAESGSQKAEAGGWQNKPLTASAEKVAGLLGGREVWVRIVMLNTCGLKTGVSNRISGVQVIVTIGGRGSAAVDPQFLPRDAWGKLQQQTGWRGIALDWADPPAHRPPYYFEDVDGWLQEPNAMTGLTSDDRQGFSIRRAYMSEGRSPLAVAAFVRIERAAGPLMARIAVRSTRDSSRGMRVLWDGRAAGTFDVASYLERDSVYFITLPGANADGVHEIRVAGLDAGEVALRQIMLVGDAMLQWVSKPGLPPSAPPIVLGADYLPDPPPPSGSQAVEGRPDTPGGAIDIGALQRLYREHPDFGAIRLVLKNQGQASVRVANALLLNGRSVEEGYVDFVKSPWDGRGVVWYRVRPRLMAPGQCSEIYVRFRRRPEGDAARITVPFENAPPLNIEVPYREPRMAIDYVTTGRSMDVLYVYVRRGGHSDVPRMGGLALDGRPLTEVRVYGRDFPGGVALLTAKLPVPLKPYEYHVVSVQVEGAGQPPAAAQFRVLPFVFPRGSIHTPVDLCPPMNMNVTMWRMVELESCDRFDLMTTCSEHEVFDTHRRVAYIFGPDEPDAHDNRGGGYDRGLGYDARRLAVAGWQELVERYAPSVASWLIMDGTIRPLNWYVYGQFADISCFDPYPVTYYGVDHAYVRESLSVARLSGTPRRMYACLEAYGWKGGQGVPQDVRGPTPAEYRQNVVQAIGSGMKGLTSWVHTAAAGGWQLDRGVAEEIAGLNALIRCIETELLLGTPADLATNDAGQVSTGAAGHETWPKSRLWTGALWCGPDTIVVAAANHIPASKSPPLKIEPSRNVTVSVRLPDHLRHVRAFEATEKGLAEFPCTPGERSISLKVDRVESGRVFVLRGHDVGR